MQWYYKTITFLPKHCNNELLAAKCMKILHGFNYEYSTRSIGVSFPLWNDDSVGRKITFVSTKRVELDLLLTQTYFIQMREINFLSISETNTVPDDCRYVSFKRCQSIDKTTPSGLVRKLKRLEKRSTARGEPFDPTSFKQHETTVLPHYHSLEENSKSKGSGFRLNIRMFEETSLKGGNCFSSYGLANSEISFQSVPLI
ncbi:type I-F CRISPR-associated endoribonuclease Cas6/Csy4 [Vibrio renipiscarius]|uniref:type I-F CRISPR-associated endoribonuclease Cas6/Csy4 n=1 Tax=Vibrio renipiscarius TaxID=1461322 RepID=UPI0035541F4D